MWQGLDREDVCMGHLEGRKPFDIDRIAFILLEEGRC